MCCNTSKLSKASAAGDAVERTDASFVTGTAAVSGGSNDGVGGVVDIRIVSM